MPATPGRLREHPARRLAEPVALIDLDQAFADLPGESREDPGDAHIQKVVFRHGPCTTAIFAFAPGTSLPQHRVEGEAILHCLSGRLDVRTNGTTYSLTPGQLLCLAPGVPHDLAADAEARALLHVVLDDEAR